MSDSLRLEIDDTALVAALDAIPEAVHAHLKRASHVTADRIATEARARIRRRTGKTGDAITVEETHNGDGYVVFVGGGRTHIGRFNEFSTQFMRAQPFLFASARLEAGAAFRRSADAVQAAIDAQGLGD